MLGWALKRDSRGHAPPPSADDTQIDQPDTPAPVFAVRALRTAIFGTPAPREVEYDQNLDMTRERISQSTDFGLAEANFKSPSKPPGILLTPGTGTSRRKRVSFGHGVKAGAAVKGDSHSGLPDDCPGKFPSPWVAKVDGTSQSRPKTRLTEALEKSRKVKSNVSGIDDQAPASEAGQVQEDEEFWEEVDDVDRDADVTVDLNEPHSRSGRYWKSYFENYHADALAEMEKLVKYKQLAKSYAKQKDSEALDLNDRLKKEQEKVRAMEQQLAEMGQQVTARAKRSGGQYDSGLVDDLAKQTALAQEYKEQVKELEEMWQELELGSEEKGPRQRRIASPRTQETLMETQRELRRARNQAKEADRTREDRDRLKSELKFAEQRAAKLAEENRKMAEDLTKTTSRLHDLENEVAGARTEARQKDRELRKLKTEHEQVKEDAKKRFVEATTVLEKKNEIIEHLKREIESLKSEGSGPRLSSQAKSLEARLRSRNEPIEAPAKENTLKFIATAEEESTLLLNELDKLRKASIERGLIPAHGRGRSVREGTKKGRDARDILAVDKEEPASSHILREKFESDLGRRSSLAFSARGNLQDTRSSSSNNQDSCAVTETRGKNLDVKSVKQGSSALPASDGDEFIITTRTRPASTSFGTKKTPSSRNMSAESESPQIDLVQSHFARLGGPDMHNSSIFSMNVSKTTLPANRHAAAVARLQQRQFERGKGYTRPDRNKENIRP